jgi:hypothetical protein
MIARNHFQLHYTRSLCLSWISENRIRDGKKTLRWEKLSCRRLTDNQARLLIGFLAYKLLHEQGQFYLLGEEVKRSTGWLIRPLGRFRAKAESCGSMCRFVEPRRVPWIGTNSLFAALVDRDDFN